MRALEVAQVLCLAMLLLWTQGCDDGADGDADADADVDSDVDGDGDSDADSDADGCDGCEIEGVCVADGATNPDNSCQGCDPDSSLTSWSDVDGGSCDDGSFCNGADTCSEGACTEHAGDPCTGEEVCFEGEDACCAPDGGLGCNADGDVIAIDSCGNEGEVVEECPDIEHGACGGGACGCEAGFAGEDCTGCVVYVSGDAGDDAGDGRSWAGAKATVQAGIDLAGPDGCEVWVAAAASPYLPTHGAGGRDLTIQLLDGTLLYGGFVGDEVSRDQRDPEANETVLTGDVGTAGDDTDNACHVVTGGPNAVIDGFTIRGGRATCTGGTFPATAVHGGGLHNPAATLTVAGCRFVDNTAGTYGGGLYSSGGPITISRCTFVENTASWGGGAFIDGTTASFDECLFDDNTATGNGGGLGAFTATVELLASDVTNNEAGDDGGGLSLGDASSATAADITFADNLAGGTGGGVSNSESTFSGLRCTFNGNEALGEGGGYGMDTEFWGGETTLERCRFYENVAGTLGGGAYIGECSRPTVRNSAFVANSAGTMLGGVVSGEGECYAHYYNNIIWGNTAPTLPNVGWFRCSSWLHNIIGGTTCAGENHNVDVDPRLVNVDPSVGPIDLYPLPTSPCIDAGHDVEAVVTDFVGSAWLDDPLTANCDGSVPSAPECSFISDIGVYEYVP